MKAIQVKSLFDRIGGINAVNSAVDIFYTKVLEDQRLSQFFHHLDLNRQSGRLKVFLAYAFGAPLEYKGKSMREAHEHLYLTEVHFNAVAEHLVATLTELNVSQDLIHEVLHIIRQTQKDVLDVSGHELPGISAS